MRIFTLLLSVILVVVLCSDVRPQDKQSPLRGHEEIIYGHKDGMALTLDYLAPHKPNGAAIIWVMSGGWFSRRDPLLTSEQRAGAARSFLDKGYSMFLVYHGTQPRYTIPEIVQDMHRSVRFIRHNAKKFGIDPQRIGVTGGSAGGHLSLMLGTTGAKGEEKAKDPIDRDSSAVQAVACFFPPTDFLNYGKEGEDAVGVGILKNFRPAFSSREQTAAERKELGKKISPTYFVTEKTPPTLITHGDADLLVPIQQAEVFIKKCEEAKVPCQLIRKEKLAHGWAGMDKDIATFVEWFDKHLPAKEGKKEDK